MTKQDMHFYVDGFNHQLFAHTWLISTHSLHTLSFHIRGLETPFMQTQVGRSILILRTISFNDVLPSKMHVYTYLFILYFCIVQLSKETSVNKLNMYLLRLDYLFLF